MVFDCHRTHMLHDECFEQLEKFALKAKQQLTCPICREPVDKTKMTKKKLQEAEAHAEVYDPFQVAGNNAIPAIGPDPTRLGGPVAKSQVAPTTLQDVEM